MKRLTKHSFGCKPRCASFAPHRLVVRYRIMKYLFVLITLVFLCSCGTTFGPGFSAYDKSYFKEIPKIVKDNQNYKLQWVYGEMGFYFFPECRVIKTELLCSLQGSSSTGNRAGLTDSISITNTNKIRAIEKQNVYWLQPDGSKIQIKIANDT